MGALVDNCLKMIDKERNFRPPVHCAGGQCGAVWGCKPGGWAGGACQAAAGPACRRSLHTGAQRSMHSVCAQRGSGSCWACLLKLTHTCAHRSMCTIHHAASPPTPARHASTLPCSASACNCNVVVFLHMSAPAVPARVHTYMRINTHGHAHHARDTGATPSPPQVSSRATDQPRPLYHSTAANLGLHSSRGVPPLLDCLLPPSTPAAARAWLRGLLLFPPPPRVGAAVLAACRQLRGERGLGGCSSGHSGRGCVAGTSRMGISCYMQHRSAALTAAASCMWVLCYPPSPPHSAHTYQPPTVPRIPPPTHTHPGAELEVPVPRFPSVGVTNVVLKLTMREANDIFFREVRHALLVALTNGVLKLKAEDHIQEWVVRRCW